MLSVDMKIDRAQRLLRMMEEYTPVLAVRVADLTPEHQQSAKSYADQVIAHTRAQLELLSREKNVGTAGNSASRSSD